ncbi:MAG: PorP/SprF family type IX secretion system membrane protein [Saprospiraceae bacterium]
MRFFLLLLFISLLCGAFNINAQDKLMTQAFAHPVDLNPAFAGSIDGRYRVSIGYRDQWRSMIESPFTTMGVYGDIKIIQDRNDDFIGAGFSLITDKTAIFNVNQNILTLYGSYHKALNPDKGQYISGGLSLGIAQRSINYENVFFDDQFNGLDDYSLGTAEILPSNNFAFFDAGLGIKVDSKLGAYSGMSLGAAIDHIPGASISFYNRQEESNIEYPDIKLYRKVSGFVSLELASNEYVSILPRLLFQKQGPHQMLAAAALVKFDITNYDNQSVHFGGGVRLNQTTSSALKPSTFYLLAAYEVKGLLIGLSHDMVITSLAADDPGKGAFELSISFTGFYDNEESLCPTF